MVIWQSANQDGRSWGVYGDFAEEGSPAATVPDPLYVILLGCGVFFLNHRLASSKEKNLGKKD